jgi:putative transposase
MEYKKKAHAVYYAQYHIVISTKYRRKVLKAGIGDYLKRKVLQVSKFPPVLTGGNLLHAFVGRCLT